MSPIPVRKYSDFIQPCQLSEERQIQTKSSSGGPHNVNIKSEAIQFDSMQYNRQWSIIQYEQINK